MSILEKTNYFILTGAMGAGKSTILHELISHNMITIAEPARAIIAEQRSIEGEGLYHRDTKLFIELMLSRAIDQFKQTQHYVGPVIFDRGIPDIISYANSAGLTLMHAHKAAKTYRCNDIVFFAPAWKEIYRTDEERTMSFAAAKLFGDDLKNVYLSLGYQVIDLPFDTPVVRAQFILNQIIENSAKN